MVDRDEALDLISDLDSIDMSHFAIVGSYTRYDERVRQALKDACVRIAAGCESTHTRENHLIWAAPGSGKTYFVEQIAASNPQIGYREVNLAQLDEDGFRGDLAQVVTNGGPMVCLVDEIDAKPDAAWPYELLLPALDANLDQQGGLVFVLAGSSGSTKEEFKQRIAARAKGVDLLSRIPQSNECEIAPMDAGDRALVTITQMLNAAAGTGRSVRAVEKLALYYVAKSPELANARQLREFAVRAVERGSRSDDRVKYDDLFDSGDPENKRFWIAAMPEAETLVNSFVLIDSEPAVAPSHLPQPEPGPLEELRPPALDDRPDSDLPAPRSPSQTTLPIPSTAFLGRSRELDEMLELLRREDVRLLTITGPGGVGKTRLAGALASAAAEEFADGVVLVPLQAIRDPDHVIGTVARSLGLFDGEGDLEQRLVAHVEGRRLLLVLDNFEQVVDAAPSLASVVAASPTLKVAVTSRTRLRVNGEQEFPLAPLARETAVSLFCERARAVRPDFQPDEADLDALSEICDRLDCLPLAIELAAARVKLLSPAAMLARLEHRLELLTSGSRDAPARHRALRDTIGWSVELLDEDERALFRRLSAFVGGCTLEAVEDVCGGDLDALGSLVDKSLVHVDGERFAMLETIREYAGELLDESAEAGDVRRAHAAHYRRLAQAVTTDGGATGRTTLQIEHDNLRAALRLSLDAGEPATAIELCALLWRFWFERGYLSEGRLWLDESLAAPCEASATRARVLSGNGVLAHYQGDYDRADELCREALDLSRSLDDARGVAEAQTGLALVRRTRGDYAKAETLFREALAVYEGLGDEHGVARALDRLALCLVVAGDVEGARALFERSLELFRQLGDAHGVALGLYGLAMTRPPDAHAAALARAGESLDILRAVGDRRTFGKVLWCVADINADAGDADTAAAQFQESLTLFVEFGDRWFAGLVLESGAFLAAGTGDAVRAVRLLAAADGIRAALGVPLWVGLRKRREQVLAETRGLLGEAGFATAWEEGRRTSLAATIELISPVAADVDAAGDLTARELEVLALVAEGLTDAEVADRLVVSLRTVHAHLRSIYRKLDVHTRSAATRYALEHGLA